MDIALAANSRRVVEDFRGRFAHLLDCRVAALLQGLSRDSKGSNASRPGSERLGGDRGTGNIGKVAIETAGLDRLSLAVGPN